jgi:hypothetical protein
MDTTIGILSYGNIEIHRKEKKLKVSPLPTPSFFPLSPPSLLLLPPLFSLPYPILTIQLGGIIE